MLAANPLRRIALLFVVTTFVVLGGFSVPGDASACGGFFARRPPQATEAELAKTLPYLTVEQVLVVWDEETGIEDFVREARFDRTNQSFGFVVPLPSKPEVFPVKKAPFDALRKDFPFDPPRLDLGIARGGGGAPGGSKGAADTPPPVVVLSEQRIGSFTAFVLMANDRAGFDKWLEENGFATTPQSSAWLAEYVKLGFYFVAFRYEPSKAKGGDAGAGETGMTSETVRIRFKTPLPFYPYREPDHAEGTPKPDKRMLSAWLVTKRPMDGVVQKRTRNAFYRPWTMGLTKVPTREALAAALGELGTVLPEGAATLNVTTFRDLKTSREGYGDALFVPKTTMNLTAAQLEERRRLLPVLDHRLRDDVDAGLDDGAPAPPPPAPSATPAPSASAAPARSAGCSSSGASPTNVLFGIGALAIIAVARRSRRGVAVALVVLGLVACKKTPVESTAEAGATEDASAAAAPVRQPPRTKADLEKEAAALLDGTNTAVILPSEQPGPSGGVGLAGLGVQARGKVTATGKTDKPLTAFERSVANLRSRFRACYHAALQHDPTLEGKIVVAFHIEPSGEVSDAKIDKNEKMTPPVASCVINATKTTRFETGTGTNAKIDIVFAPDL